MSGMYLLAVCLIVFAAQALHFFRFLSNEEYGAAAGQAVIAALMVLIMLKVMETGI